MMRLSPPIDELMRQNMRAIEQEDRLNLKRNENIDLGSNYIVLTAPNGTKYKLGVNNAGTLTATLL